MLVRSAWGVSVVLAVLVLSSSAASAGEERCKPAVQPAHGPQLRSVAVATQLERGRTVDLVGAVLRGDLDLRGDVGHIFRCRRCLVEGDLVAEDVSFGRLVDLRGSTITGDMRLNGAVFEGPALFDSLREWTTTFRGRADFTRARFHDVASFREASFTEPAVFESSQFGGDASFAYACFAAAALFPAASFAGEASFVGSKTEPFSGRAGFEDTRFSEAADFRGRHFDGEATFGRAVFRAGADFSRTDFGDDTVFDGVRFSEDTTYLGAVFRRDASFNRAAAKETLDFSEARFLASANFFDFASDGTLSFDGTTLGGLLFVSDDTSASDIRLDLDGVVAALEQGDPAFEEHFLGLVESTAKARGDLALANDALFERRKLIAEQYGWPLRLGDRLIYRGVAGYLVRPFHPLVTLFCVALGFAAVHRYFRGGKHKTADPSTGPAAGLRGLGAELPALAGAAFVRLRMVVKSPSDLFQTAETQDGALVWTEAWIYRTLVALAAVALANSNPTLRQMFDAIV